MDISLGDDKDHRRFLYRAARAKKIKTQKNCERPERTACDLCTPAPQHKNSAALYCQCGVTICHLCTSRLICKRGNTYVDGLILCPFCKKEIVMERKSVLKAKRYQDALIELAWGKIFPGVHKGVEEEAYYALVHLWMGIVYFTDENFGSLREIQNNFKIPDDEDIDVYITQHLLRDNETLPVQLFSSDIDLSESTLDEIDLEISRLYLWRTSQKKYELLPLGPLEHLKFAQGGLIFVDELYNIKLIEKIDSTPLVSPSENSVVEVSNTDKSHEDSSIKEERVDFSHLYATADDEWDMLFDFQMEYRTRGDRSMSVKHFLDSLGLSDKLGYCLATKRRLSNKKGRNEYSLREKLRELFEKDQDELIRAQKKLSLPAVAPELPIAQYSAAAGTSSSSNHYIQNYNSESSPSSRKRKLAENCSHESSNGLVPQITRLPSTVSRKHELNADILAMQDSKKTFSSSSKRPLETSPSGGIDKYSVGSEVTVCDADTIVRSPDDQEWEILFNFQRDFRLKAGGMSAQKFLVMLGVSQPKSLEGFLWNSRALTPSSQPSTKAFAFRQQLKEFMAASSGTGIGNTARLLTQSTPATSSVFPTHTAAPSQQRVKIDTVSEKVYNQPAPLNLKRRGLVVDSDDECDERHNSIDDTSKQQAKKAKDRHNTSMVGDLLPEKRVDHQPLKVSTKTIHSSSHSHTAAVDQGRRPITHLGTRNAALVVKKVVKVYLPVTETPGVNFAGLLLGPRGESLQRLEQCTGAAIAIRGKGTLRDGGSSSRGHPDDGDDLHVSLEGSENAVRKAFIEIRRIIDTAKLISESRSERLQPPLPEKSLSAEHNRPAGYPKYDQATQSKPCILDKVAGSTVSTAIKKEAVQTTTTTAQNPWNKVSDPRLGGRGSQSRSMCIVAAPPALAPAALANSMSNMLEMECFLSSQASRCAGKSSSAVPSAIDNSTRSQSVELATEDGKFLDQCSSKLEFADTKKAELLYAKNDHKSSGRSSELVDAIKKHLLLHKADTQQLQSRTLVQFGPPQPAIESSTSAFQTIRTLKTLEAAAAAAALTAPAEMAHQKTEAIVSGSCMPQLFHSELAVEPVQSKSKKPAAVQYQEFKGAHVGNCTACGKYGHAFEGCWFVRSNHTNVNWDRSEKFSASETGSLYIARTTFAHLKPDVFVSASRKAAADDNSAAESDDLRSRHKKDILRNHYPCTACGNASHSFESCALLSSSSDALNIDRTLNFADFEEGQARKEIARGSYPKKSSSCSVDSVELLENIRGDSPPVCDDRRLPNPIVRCHSRHSSSNSSSASVDSHSHREFYQGDSRRSSNHHRSRYQDPFYRDADRDHRDRDRNGNRPCYDHSGPDSDRWRDRTLYKHFPCTACGKFNHSYERCFFLRCENLHPYINFDRSLDFRQSGVGMDYTRLTGYQSLLTDDGFTCGVDQCGSGREQRRHGGQRSLEGKEATAAVNCSKDRIIANSTIPVSAHTTLYRGAGTGQPDIWMQEDFGRGYGTEMVKIKKECNK